jgi:glycine/D-amino acid oxidase-like deaminating enzyme
MDRAEFPATADVVVIGGGPAGVAALWAIERFAPGTRGVLLEQGDQLGSGSTLASLEAYRTCWPTVCLARQMRRSVEVFHDADAYLGEGATQSIALKEQGYVFCAFTERQAAGFRSDVARLHEVGVTHVEVLDGGEVAYRFPWLGPHVVGAKFDPVAGWLDSNALIHRYAKAAKAARIVFGIQQARIEVRQNRVRGVSTERGEIATPNVLIAAGAEARAVGRTAGVELPIVVIPRQSFTTGWRHPEFPANAPLVIGAAPHPHARPEAGSGAMFGWEYRWNTKRTPQADRPGVHDSLIDPVCPVESLKDIRFPPVALALLARQFRHRDGEGFASPRYLSGIRHNIGYYVYRDSSSAYALDADGAPKPYESERAIIDAHPGVEGLYLSIAHAGHGIMTSPAAGEIAASLILRRALSDPSFADFGLNVPWVAHDAPVL